MNQLAPIQMQQHRIKGRILYTSKKPERLDEERGAQTLPR